jgi:hypothetical protein
MADASPQQHVIVHGSKEAVFDTAYGDKQIKEAVARCVCHGRTNVKAVLAEAHWERHGS